MRAFFRLAEPTVVMKTVIPQREHFAGAEPFSPA
jgi:hypothetical protein